MSTPQLTVWYNTRCPVCDAGIRRQRGKLIAAVKAGTIAFRDINQEPEALAQFGATVNDVRRRLHATDQEGRLLVGADVAVAVWRLTPGEGFLASCSATGSRSRSRASPTTASPTCCSPGTGARGGGEQASGQGLHSEA